MSNYKIRIDFDEEWVLSRRSDSELPGERILRFIKEKFDVCKKATLQPAVIEAVIDTDSTEAKVSDDIIEYASIAYKFDKSACECYFNIKVTPVAAEVSVKKEDAEKKAVNDNPAFETLEEIRALVGADEFKALAEEIYKVAGGLKKNNIVESFVMRSYIVSVSDGYGLTTYLNLFVKLVNGLGLFDFTRDCPVKEIEFPRPANKNDDNTDELIASIFKEPPYKKLVCIDISEWTDDMSNHHFMKLMDNISSNLGLSIYFLRVPYIEKNVFREIEVRINDVLYEKAFSIVPFSLQQLRCCAENILQKKGFTMDSEAWDIFDARIAVEKNDGKFYGIDTVKKIVFEMLYLKQLYNVDNNIDGFAIKGREITALANISNVREKTGMEMLDELVGADDIRKQILDIVAQIEYAHNAASERHPCIHMQFVGNPGTGKTTVARIIGAILKEKGILRNGNFFEIFSRDLCGQYIGSTAPKTASICRDAYGSVLFIDEAYALYRPDSGRDYGLEAIAALIAQMENHRDDFVIIMAGYVDEMKTLMESNPGLKSRIPYTIEFPNYTKEQLIGIFLKMVDEKYTYDKAFEEAVSSYFNSLSDEDIKSKEFNNARFVRNLFERTWGKAVLRCQMEGRLECSTLTADDFKMASADKEFSMISGQKKRRVGFGD